jgi:ribonuclease R
LERERAKYDSPLPSREYILQVMNQIGTPVDDRSLMRLLEIEVEEKDVFARRLRAMERDGQIMRNRKNDLCVSEKLHLTTGVVIGNAGGFGFLKVDGAPSDFFLPATEMRKVMHGDRVSIRVTGLDGRGRQEAAIVEVLERAQHKLVGRLHLERGLAFVRPEDRRITQDIVVPLQATRKAQDGQVVVVEIVEPPQWHAPPVGKVVEVLGGYADPGMEVEIALRKHNLPHVFSVAVERACAKFSTGVLAKDLDGRTDLRHLDFVTIDGETAKDFDDAVYCESIGKGFRLWVSIADVSHYVRTGDALDLEARERGTSVYFPRRVIPMLPETLSNELCSLKPQVDRLCVTCEMDISHKGDIKDYKFYPSIIHSRARLTYTVVATALTGGSMDPVAVVPMIQSLHRLYALLAKARTQRGAIDFETVETQMIFDELGKIARIERLERNDAHRLIEECMLAANVCASEYLQKAEQATLYRVHEGPTPEKLAALREFLAEFGLQLGGGDDPQAKDYARLLEKVKGRPDRELLQTVMLRSLRQAIYSPENAGHFGLAYSAYAHFTSPIRRYPDLLVHRAIKSVLQGKSYDPGDWKALGVHCSEVERRADEASRDVSAWLKCEYMKERVGEVFDGTISGVTGFGVFVALDDVYVEGLVHISELGSDYFEFDAAKHQLVGERTRQVIRLGGRMRVTLVRVDLDSARIDFVPAV